MYGEYFVVAGAAILTLLVGSLELIEGAGIGHYLMVFIALTIIGFIILVTYRKVVPADNRT
jgi:hypothetical protein